MSENLFSITNDTEETVGLNYITVDKEEDFVQDNLLVKSLELSEDGRFFIITAEKNGKTIQTQRQYFPDRSTAQNDESFKKAFSIKQGLLAHFLRRFKGEDAVIDAEGWQDLVKKIDAACKPLYATIPLRTKLELVENKGKYYSNISTFGPFEHMSIPRSESVLKITGKDRVMLKNKLREESIVPDKDVDTKKDDDIF